MKRNVTMAEISDGNLYTANDMVKAGCRDCEGCSACCRNMGNSLQLDPYDIWQLSTGLGKNFEEMLQSGWIELGVTDGMILPYLKTNQDAGAGDADVDAEPKGSCPFLNQEGRCKVHAFRPGICRLFPLGRYYEEDGNGFRYFLQIHECQKTDRTKIKVKKWLGIPELKHYEAYIVSWHHLLKTCEESTGELSEEEQKILQMVMLRTFYQTPYPGKNKEDLEQPEQFYEAYEERRQMIREKLGL